MIKCVTSYLDRNKRTERVGHFLAAYHHGHRRIDDLVLSSAWYLLLCDTSFAVRDGEASSSKSNHNFGWHNHWPLRLHLSSSTCVLRNVFGSARIHTSNNYGAGRSLHFGDLCIKGILSGTCPGRAMFVQSLLTSRRILTHVQLTPCLCSKDARAWSKRAELSTHRLPASKFWANHSPNRSAGSQRTVSFDT